MELCDLTHNESAVVALFKKVNRSVSDGLRFTDFAYLIQTDAELDLAPSLSR